MPAAHDRSSDRIDAAAWIEAGRSAVAALPFLPRGKGPEILMMGGMSTLGLSMAWSIIRSARRLTGRSTGPHLAAQSAQPVPSAAPPRTPSSVPSTVPFTVPSTVLSTGSTALSAGPLPTPSTAPSTAPPAAPALPAPHGRGFPARPGPGREKRTAAGQRAASAWADELLAALGSSLGPCQVLSSAPHRVVVRLTRCPSCRPGGSGRLGPCTTARRDLQRAASAAGRGVSVHEASCRFGGKASCTFVVERGG